MTFDLKFKGKLRENGNSTVVTVPPAIVDIIGKEEEYEFKIQKTGDTNDTETVKEI